MYTRKEAEFTFIDFQLSLIGELSGLVQFIEKVGFSLNTAGCAVNILLLVRRSTIHWHQTSFQQYSSTLVHHRNVD